MTHRISVAWALAALVGTGGLLRPAGTASGAGQITPSKGRAELMHEQFRSVMGAHDSIIRGNLQGAKNEARLVAHFPDPVGLRSGRGAVSGGDEGLCRTRRGCAPICPRPRRPPGRCWRPAAIATVRSARCLRIRRRRKPPIGGVIGHMLTHQAALDLLVQGLTTPSTSLWNQGADALVAAPLRKGQLPSDAKVSGEVLKSEKHVHELATRARLAEDTPSRVAVYSELVQSCATCHGANRKGYGPTYR